MKLIFLDIDGVLNYAGCKARSPSKCLGIEEEPLKFLKQIVDATHAKIVLTSTWKTDWEKTNHIEDLPRDGQYLVSKLKEQNISILDKTYEYKWSERGKGILQYIRALPQVPESIVILDDERFDFQDVGLSKYFVKTSFYDKGLTKSEAEDVIKILMNEVYEN